MSRAKAFGDVIGVQDIRLKITKHPTPHEPQNSNPRSHPHHLKSLSSDAIFSEESVRFQVLQQGDYTKTP